MALVIENGTGVSGADSFTTVDECSAHAVAYSGASLTGSPADKEAALRRAFIAMSGLYWSDGLWPTFGGTIPAPVKLAQSVMARAEFQKPGALSPQVTLAGQKVLTGLKGITWQVIGDKAGVEDARPVLTMAMDLLRPYLKFDPSRDRSIGLGMRSVG